MTKESSFKLLTFSNDGPSSVNNQCHIKYVELFDRMKLFDALIELISFKGAMR